VNIDTKIKITEKEKVNT